MSHAYHTLALMGSEADRCSALGRDAEIADRDIATLRSIGSRDLADSAPQTELNARSNQVGLDDQSGPKMRIDLATEAALAALAQSSVAELRFLRVDRHEEKLCLSGRVRSFYHKQLAQEAVRLVADGREVVNQVLVV